MILPPVFCVCGKVTTLVTHVQVREKLCEGLAQKIHQQLNVETRRQVIFELMGGDFQRTYFPTEPYDPSILVSSLPIYVG